MAKIFDCYSARTKWATQCKWKALVQCAVPRHAPNVTKMLSFIFIEKFAWNFYFHKYHRVALSVRVCIYVYIACVFLRLVFFMPSFGPACTSIELNHLSGEYIALYTYLIEYSFEKCFRIFVEKKIWNNNNRMEKRCDPGQFKILCTTRNRLIVSKKKRNEQTDKRWAISNMQTRVKDTSGGELDCLSNRCHWNCLRENL